MVLLLQHTCISTLGIWTSVTCLQTWFITANWTKDSASERRPSHVYSLMVWIKLTWIDWATKTNAAAAATNCDHNSSKCKMLEVTDLKCLEIQNKKQRQLCLAYRPTADDYAHQEAKATTDPTPKRWHLYLQFRQQPPHHTHATNLVAWNPKIWLDIDRQPN